MVIDITTDTIEKIDIGRQYENHVVDVTFDYTDWAEEFGEGTLRLLVMRRGDEVPYSPELEVDGTTATWHVSSLDTEIRGVGKIECTYVVDDQVKKSAVARTSVKAGIYGNGEPRDPFEAFLDALEELAETTQEYAEAAEDAKDTAVASAQSASADAQSTTEDVETVRGLVQGSQSQLGVLEARMDTFASLPAGSTAGNAELVDIRVGDDGVTYSTAGDAVRGQFSNLKSDIDEINDAIVVAYDTLSPYLYKKNTYINSSGVDTALNGYDTFKIPLDAFDVLHFTWDAEFWTGLSISYVANVEFTDSARASMYIGILPYAYFTPTNISEGIAFGEIPNISNVSAVYITAKSGLADNVHLSINKVGTQYSFEKVNPINLDSANSIQTRFYYRGSDFGLFNSPYYANWVKLNEGDRIVIEKTVTGVSGKGILIDSDGNVSTLYSASYTAKSECILCIYNNSNASGEITLIPMSNFTTIDDGKTLKFIAGVIRNSGSGWSFIDDSGHNPLNISSVSVDSGGRIVLDYGFTASKVLSLVACPDETFAPLYTIGGSVGISQAVLNVNRLPRSYGGLVVISNNVVDVYKTTFTSGTFNTSTGEIRLYHPTLAFLPASEKFNICANVYEHDINVRMGSQGNDYVSLFLYNSNGNLVKDVSNVSLYALRQVNTVFVNANDVIDAGGNFWIYGVMEV